MEVSELIGWIMHQEYFQEQVLCIVDFLFVYTTRKLKAHKEEKNEYHIYQPLRSGRIWHKVNF